MDARLESLMTLSPTTAEPRDDDLLELPAIDGSEGEGEDLSFVDDELDDEEGGERVGLDASVGMDEPDDVWEESDVDDEDEDLSSWESSEEPIEEDPGLGDEEEGGWVAGSEAGSADGEFDDPSSGTDEDEHTLVRDAGEEGVEERFEADGLDDAPLGGGEDRHGDESAEDLDLEEEAEIEALPEFRHPALDLPRMLIEVQRLGAAESGATRPSLVFGGDVVRVWGPPEGPLRILRAGVDEPLELPSLGPLGEDEAVFVCGMGPHLIVSVDGPGRVPLASSDHGETWRELEFLRDAGPIALTGGEADAVLYAALFIEEVARALIIRVPLHPGGTPTAVIDSGALHLRGEPRIRMLEIERLNDERMLRVTSGVGVLRARI